MSKKTIEERERDLTKREAALKKEEMRIAAASEILYGQDFSQAQEKRELTEEEEALIKEACKAYGIDRQYIFHSRVGPCGPKRVVYGPREDKDMLEAVIVTHGGKKVFYAKGDEVKKLTHTEVTGKLSKEDKKEGLVEKARKRLFL